MDVTRVKASEGGAKCVRLAHSALWPHRKTNMQMTEHPIKSVRRAGVPLVALETADPAMAIAAIRRALNGKGDAMPVMQWDIVRGLIGVNDAGAQVCSEMDASPINTGNPTECLTLLQKLPQDSIVFWHNGHRYLDNVSVIQGLWLLRDTLKAIHGTVILLGPAFTLPAELKHDVVVLSEALPSQEEIDRIVASICADAGVTVPEDSNKVSDALLGLSAFAAEQCLAMSIGKDGIDRAGLWERKRKTIEQTKGLSVWRGGESFSAIGGCDNVKGFMRDIMAGRKAPRATVFIDEIEKSLAGTGGDTSGVSQDYLGQLLSFMQDKGAAGCIFIGPPGAAKSVVAKASGNEANVPTIQLDLGGMKGSLVGQSEQTLRTALQVVDAVSQGQMLFIATCNSFGNLPPELKRRFTLGTFFFDLPDLTERDLIWKIYRAKYEIGSDPTPSDTGWTGAEIKQCCEIAWRLRRSLVEAAKFIVPVAKSAAETIQRLREQANGKFISASYSGLFKYSAQAAPTGRKLGD